MEAPRQSKRALRLLTIGAFAGLVLAAWGLIRPGEALRASLPDDAVALVNGTRIRQADFLRLVAGVERDAREPVGRELRDRVLLRMIEEELLVQRALELGLAEVDRRVRADLVGAVIQSITADAEQQEPSDAELREFYGEERDFFTRPGRARVHQIFFRVRVAEEDEPALSRAREARRRLLDGVAWTTVREEEGDEEISPVPDALLPAQKLLEYLGPTALRTALELEPGAWSEPVRSGSGYHLLQPVHREPALVPDFEAIEPLVRNEWTRRTGDRALRAYLDELRRDAEIVLRAE